MMSPMKAPVKSDEVKKVNLVASIASYEIGVEKTIDPAVIDSIAGFNIYSPNKKRNKVQTLSKEDVEMLSNERLYRPKKPSLNLESIPSGEEEFRQGQVREEQTEEEQLEEEILEERQLEKEHMEEQKLEEEEEQLEGNLDEGQLEEEKLEEEPLVKEQFEEEKLEEEQLEEEKLEQQLEEKKLEKGQLEEEQLEEGKFRENQFEFKMHPDEEIGILEKDNNYDSGSSICGDSNDSLSEGHSNESPSDWKFFEDIPLDRDSSGDSKENSFGTKEIKTHRNKFEKLSEDSSYLEEGGWREDEEGELLDETGSKIHFVDDIVKQNKFIPQQEKSRNQPAQNSEGKKSKAFFATVSNLFRRKN